MTYENHARKIDELARSEGGIFTSAQAVRSGIPRDALSYALRTGRLERIVRGAYKMASSPDSSFDTLAAFWKLTRPSAYGFERASSFDGIVIGGSSACYVHGIGVLQPEPCRIYAPERMRSKLSGISFAQREVAEQDVMLKEGMRVTRPERTILDLVLDHEDLSLVADTLQDARAQLEASGGFSMKRLRELFEGVRAGGVGGSNLVDMLIADGR